MKATKKIFFSLCVASSLMWGYSNTVYKVQQQLSELGYSVGVDGEMGRGTARAIRQYQKDNGLRVTGRVTNELLSSLGISRGGTTSRSSTSQSDYRDGNEGGFFDGLGGNLSDSLKNGKYQIGFLAAWPAYGVSLKMDYSNKMTFEVVAAPLGTFSLYSAKVNYYLNKQRKYNTYAYVAGGVGIYEYSGIGKWEWENGHYSYKSNSETETVPMFGAGVGMEWSWRNILGKDIPNLYSTFEVGYAHMSFDYYNFGGLIYGGGIYYKF